MVPSAGANLNVYEEQFRGYKKSLLNVRFPLVVVVNQDLSPVWYKTEGQSLDGV